ncbi:MAG: class I SAM-dependent methyltransferase [Myxococcales bacterium]
MEHDRHGAKQPHRFDPAKAGRLDDRARFESLPPGEVIALLDAPQGGRVVDFGTGTGSYALELAAARPDLEVFALDEQRAMLERLAAKLAARTLANVKPVMAHTPAARGLEGRADRVLAVNVLHELGDAALQELAALLTPDGRALFVDWNAEADRSAGPPNEHVYSPDAAAERLARFGFSVQERRLFRDHYALSCRRL